MDFITIEALMIFVKKKRVICFISPFIFCQNLSWLNPHGFYKWEPFYETQNTKVMNEFTDYKE